MTTTFQPIGRAVPVRAEPDTGLDKWQVLNNLTDAATRFGMSHRTLSVLKALLTYLPGRTLPTGGASVVFPSNRNLSQRLSGMPESTLRRHLGLLVKAGLVSRQDSPNRKRYARRINGAGGIAFGFDLAPLGRLATRIADAATQARTQAQEHAVLRAELSSLRHAVMSQDPDLAEDIRKALRRQNNAAELRALKSTAQTLATEDVIATDSENERHIQKAEEKDSVDKVNNPDDPTLQDIRRGCAAYRSYFPEAQHTWPDVMTCAEKLAPMIGIEQATMSRARRSMGAKSAAASVLSILERLTNIRNPGGYLQHLAKLSEQGRYDVRKTLNAMSDRPESMKIVS